MLTFNYYNQGNTNFNLKITSRIMTPSVRRYNKVSILGKDGEVYKDTGNFEDTNIELNVFITKKTNLQSQFLEIRNWLCKKISDDSKLTFSDNSIFFYKVKKVEITNVEPVFTDQALKFKVIFTVDAYNYQICNFENLTETINNPYEISMPLFEITGVVGLTYAVIIGMNQINVKLFSNIINYIDVEKEISYYKDWDGKFVPTNGITSGDISKMTLNNGNNHLSCNAPLLRIMKNFRTI